jgi:hypothetical protein
LILFLSVGDNLPVAAQTIPELEEGLRSCQGNLDSLKYQMEIPCFYIKARDEVCRDTYDWLTFLYKSRRENPTSPQNPTLVAIAEKEKTFAEKERECSQTYGNIVYYCNPDYKPLYDPPNCEKANQEYSKCSSELSTLRSSLLSSEITLSYDPVLKQAWELNQRIAEQEREYKACQEQLNQRDECRRLQGQYTSVATACDDIKLKLQGIRQGRLGTEGPSTSSATVKLGTEGRVEDKVNALVTMRATLESSGQAPPGTLYGYYWYVNQVFRTSGVNMTTYSFKVPNAGLKQVKIKVRIIRTNDGGKTWQAVGEAAYDFSGMVTTRTVKIGYLNYQKLAGFTVTINGATQTCGSTFDQSRPFRQGDGDCSFNITPGPCNISVSAPGYETVSFQKTCDKDETTMTSLSKKP